MDPSCFPNPAEDSDETPRARAESLTCAICAAEWEEWVGSAQQAARCPACGYVNDLGGAG